MKLLISNQHGAVVMAIFPFLYGMILGKPMIQHLFLFLAWISFYLMTYPFFQLIKPNHNANQKLLYKKWTIIYAVSGLIFSLPAIGYNPYICYFAVAMLPLFAVNLYFVKQKNERHFLNDLAAIGIFALAGMGSYYFSDRTFDDKIYWVGSYPALFFIGTTLYVKSVLRERKNPRYFYFSVLFHLFCVVGFFIVGQYGVAVAFLLAWIRAVYLPFKSLSVKQTGIMEILISFLFFGLLLGATL